MQRADRGPASADTTAVFCSFSFTEPQNNEKELSSWRKLQKWCFSTLIGQFFRTDVPPCSTLLKLSVQKQDKSNPDESFSKSRVFVFLYHEQSQRKTDFHKNTLAQPCILACDWLLIKCCWRAHGTWITFEPDTHTNTHTSTQRLFNKACQPWRPACLVFYIIIINIIHNLVSICYSCDCVCEPACVFLFSCSREHVWACVCLFVSWNLAVLGDHVAWESGGESRTPKHLQLQLNCVALLLIKPNNTCGLSRRNLCMIKIDKRK